MIRRILRDTPLHVILADIIGLLAMGAAIFGWMYVLSAVMS